MPRKKKSGNVVDFPNKKQEAPSEEELVQKANQGVAQLIQTVDQNRLVGLKRLEECTLRYDDREAISGENAKQFSEDMLRDLESGIRSSFQTLEALNTLIDMIRHDLIGAIQNTESMQVANIQVSTYVQTLLSVLEEKGIVTEQEMKEMWDKIIPAYLAKTKQQ